MPIAPIEPRVFRVSLRNLAALLVTVISFWISPCYAVIVQGAPPPPDPRGWNSTLLLRTSIGVCTATVVGPRAILTAAHCLGQDKSINVNISGKDHSLDCNTHPDVAKNPSADFALCSLNIDLVTPPERINTDPNLVSRASKVVIAGYGCRVAGGVDAQLGEFTAGYATLVQAPTKEIAYGVTIGSSICPGDAGGGTYFYPKSNPGGRILIGVNMQGDANVQSFIPMTSSEIFLGWARSWSGSDPSKPRAICGLRGDEGCHAESSGAAPEALPRDEVRTRVQASAASLSLPQATSPTSDDKRDSILASRVMKVMTVPGMTPTSLAKQVCGEAQPNTYFDQFDKYNKASTGGLDRTSEFGTAREIILPVCAVTSRIVAVQTSKNDRLWDYWGKYTDRSLWSDFERKGAVTPDLSSSYFQDVVAGLNPGVNIQDPSQSPIIFVPRYPNPVSIANTEPGIGISAQSIAAVIGLPAGESTTSSCALGSERSDYPYDLTAVLRVLQTNRRQRKNNKRWQSINVLIADSGLDGAGISGVFEATNLLPEMDFQQLVSQIKPSIPGEARGHGTQVASVILGGPDFARIQAATDLRVRLIIKSIYRPIQIGSTPWYGPDTNWFGDVVNAAKVNGAQIVNMSLKTQAPIPMFLPEFAALSNTLYIVAAGNLDGDISLPEKQVYPARYGGTGSGRANLMTVAATSVTKDGKPELPEFSNFGAAYVDIGAPGCLVPVLSYDASSSRWRTERASGTSFATPLVSFAAAMIKSELGANSLALHTKRRLLASADLAYGLRSKIEDGRILNVVKALSVYQDVAEYTSGDLFFGSVRFKIDGDAGKDLKLTCYRDSEGSVVTIPQADLYKVRPGYNPTNQRAKVYSKGADGELFASRDCDLPDNLRVEVTEESGMPDSRPISDFRDIVLLNSAKIQ